MSWLPLTRHPKLSRASIWVKEEVILPLTYDAGGTPNPNIITLAGRILEPRVLRDGLVPEHVSKMTN